MSSGDHREPLKEKKVKSASQSRTSSLGRAGMAYLPTAGPDYAAAQRSNSICLANARHHRHRNYGTMMPDAQNMVRSASMPIHTTRVVFYKRPQKQLTVAQQSVRLAEKAKKNFFHGSFTSSHGAVFAVPTRAQQMATTRPSRSASVVRHSLSRNNSMVRRPPPIQLDTPPTTSAMKKPKGDSESTSVTTPPHENTTHGGRRSHEEAGFLSEPIILHRRANSADASLGRPSQTMHTLVISYPEGQPGMPSKEDTHKMNFRESSPDLLAVQYMRDHSATREEKPPLSPTTIAKAARALRAFEERKVRMPQSSFSNATQVNVGGSVMPIPEHTPLVLAKPPAAGAGLGDSVRRVHISSIVEENLSPEGSESDYEESINSSDLSEDNISWGAATMDFLYLAAPAAVSICFTFSMSVVPLAFVGNYLGERQLTGASVGYFIVSILITYPMIGLTFAMDTLCSHEYGRDPLSPEMGLVLQRGVFINLILLTPLCFLIYALRPFLVAVYGPYIAEEAEEFLFYAPLYLYPMMIFIAFNKFLTNQLQPHMPMIALTAGVIITPFLQMKLTPMGVRYTMIGMGITAWFQLVVVIIMTFFKPETRITLGSWRIAEALDWADVKEYMKLAIPSAIFVAAEASSFDVTVLLAAQFSEADGAAWSAIMNSLFIFASFSGGLSASACANIGRCIGGGQPISARRFVTIAIIASCVLGVVDSVVLVTCFNFLMSLFGTKGKTLTMAREVLYMLPFFHISDAVQFTFQGIFSGLGKNHLGAVILLTSLWGIGIPLSFLLGQYLGYRMYGVCIGITLGLLIEAPAMVFAASKMDYEAICDEFIEDEEEEEDSDEESEDEESEEYDEEYMEEVMRRSGISISSSSEVSEGHSARNRRLMPPRRRGRRRQVVEYDENDD